MAEPTVRPFSIRIPESDLDSLQQRLAATRWPDAETPSDWTQGLPLAYAQELCDYWQNDYQWREREAYFNGFPQFLTELDGLDIHFIHVQSAEAQARPLLMTHGWPGSVVEFHKVIGPLVDPVAYGGRAEEAFHVVCPSLPGYGFSAKPTQTGWGVERIAAAWDTLMQRLGYSRYFAQGGDWGSAVTTAQLGCKTWVSARVYTSICPMRARRKMCWRIPMTRTRWHWPAHAITPNGARGIPNSKVPVRKP